MHELPGLVGCRIAAGLTWNELAARAGIAPETLSRLEHGRPATAESVGKLAGALMVPIGVVDGGRLNHAELPGPACKPLSVVTTRS